ncbi:amino acid transporter [Microbacterium sp. Sa4CUA7]|uniref:Amino acid transporter n=1 Tax=Microbacterium pullorum TaxID=2762236 RepID=A0ABR8RY46_9MICO|nr:LysE/ArgO family amino acid transporter [Microbacterium pullorum]MBD7956171.1 amino acid transporter [Microbacterium pullorum]
MLSSVVAGFALGLSLIVAIGAQNLFVLRQGVRLEHVAAVATVCAVSDAALIAAGVSGLGAVLQAAPWLVDVVRWAGAVFLLGYAALAARRAWRPSGAVLTADARTDARTGGAAPPAVGEPVSTGTGDPAASAGAVTAHSTAGDAASVSPGVTPVSVAVPRTRTAAGLTAALLTCLALTWLNPHVYLDTVFLVGSVASTHGDGRWWFAAGAMAASIVWFFSLAYGSRCLGRWLASPHAWRMLDAAIAVIMAGLAVTLVQPR